jgi:hypothetical protein
MTDLEIDTVGAQQLQIPVNAAALARALRQLKNEYGGDSG